jgi:hypothetical protein
MTWSGVTFRRLGLLEPGAGVHVAVEIIPNDVGLQVKVRVEGGW